jgi:hypothetical protein
MGDETEGAVILYEQSGDFNFQSPEMTKPSVRYFFMPCGFRSDASRGGRLGGLPSEIHGVDPGRSSKATGVPRNQDDKKADEVVREKDS